jgi:uncharacterized protein (DUF433 family)
MGNDLLRGVYDADRAAALSGVPISTVYYWARNGIWEPALSEEKPKLWTYSDLIALRMIYWLRQDKPALEVPKSSMPEVRRAIRAIAADGERLSSSSVRLFVERNGKVIFGTLSGEWAPLVKGMAQRTQPLEVLAEFKTREGTIGPDLVNPRPSLRIIPGKLAGEPHVKGTRIASRMVAALVRDGLTEDHVVRLYPDLTRESVLDCINLEKQLQPHAA